MDAAQCCRLLESMAMTTLKDLEAEALKLPEKSRAFLAERLVASLKDWDEQDEAAGISEAERRLAEIDAGTAILYDGDEVFARLERIVNED